MLNVPMVVGEHRVQAPLNIAAFHEWTLQDGRTYAFFYRRKGNYVVRFPGLADFEVMAEGKSIIAWPVPGLDTETLRSLHLNQVTPLALSLQGQLILHASAVVLDGSCVAFAGRSGRGKSTLAASFSTSGHPFLTEDALHIDLEGSDPRAQPSHASIRLWPDSLHAVMPGTPIEGGAKVRHKATSALPFHASPVPLRALFYLGEGGTDEVQIERVAANSAFIHTVQNSFILGVADGAALASHFEAATRISALPIHYRLDFPRRFDKLPVVRDTIIRFIRGET